MKRSNKKGVQAGAELGQAQHSWDWAWLIEARASDVDGFSLNKALVSKCGGKFYPKIMLEFQCYIILSYIIATISLVVGVSFKWT